VRLYRESDPEPVIKHLAEQLSAHPEALRNWIRQDQAGCLPRWHERSPGTGTRASQPEP
jgi:transposase-like protein